MADSKGNQPSAYLFEGLATLFPTYQGGNPEEAKDEKCCHISMMIYKEESRFERIKKEEDEKATYQQQKVAARFKNITGWKPQSIGEAYIANGFLPQLNKMETNSINTTNNAVVAKARRELQMDQFKKSVSSFCRGFLPFQGLGQNQP